MPEPIGIRENQSVKVPERSNSSEHYGVGPLERFVVGATRELPSYAALPNQFVSQGIEHYVNRIFSLTASDPEHVEYAGSVRILPRTDELSYFDTVRGTQRQIPSEALAALGNAPEGTRYTVNVHSHPGNWSFSGYRGDTGNFLEEWGEQYPDGEPIYAIGTPGYNYLLVRTQETPVITDRLTIGWDLYNGYQRFRKIYKEVYPDIAERLEKDAEYKRLFDLAEQQSFGGSFDYFCRNLVNTFKIAERYKAGFYYSEKDGVYNRVTEEFVGEYIHRALDEAIEKARQTPQAA